MRFPSLIFLVGLGLSASLYPGCANKQRNPTNDAQELFALERYAINREFENDTAYLSSIMDSTFIELSKGKLKNKHDVLKTIYRENVDRKLNGIRRDSFHLNDSIIHVYENTAVVSFILKTFNKKGDSSFTRQTRFYDVWVRKNNTWKAIAWQGTPVE